MPLALEARIAIAALLGVSIALAMLGPAPRRLRPGLAGGLMGASLALYLTGALALIDEHLLLGGFAIALAGEAMCVAAWLARFRANGPAPGDDGDGGDGPDAGPGGDEGPDPLRWEEFEAAFRRYASEARERDLPSRSG